MSFALFGYQPPPSEALRVYARALYERRQDAAPVSRVEVADEGWRPGVNRCHENVEEWCILHPDHQIVRGWLFFSLPGLAYCQFVSHSVVRRPDGTLIDITPTGPLANADPYPFLPAGVSEEEYGAVAGELYNTTGSGNLYWQHTGA
ncbi:hypothetical protein ACN8ZM_04255 [Burkholderia aenigmatica]|uniref:hypothetical protein n=1 Tax=Burkholderia aenigmatica TaxID=2015348 RepID=UPI003B437C62